MNLAISIAYVLPLIIVIGLFIRCDTAQWVKVLLLIALPAFYVWHYISINKLAGWPSQQPLPPEFTLIAHQITEPKPKEDNPGNIRLWVQATGQTVSRLYQVTYSKKLHKDLVKAKQKQGEGKRQIGTHRQGGDSSSTGDGGDGDAEIRFKDKQTKRPPLKSSSQSHR